LSERGNVYSGYHKDPYDQFDFLDELNGKYQLPAIYFFLLANKRKAVDKNIHPSKKALQRVNQKNSSKVYNRIHPSWQSGERIVCWKKKSIPYQILPINRLHFLDNIT
jgi:hypothetical protein